MRKISILKIYALVLIVFLTFGTWTVQAETKLYTDLVGDKDQNPPPDPDGHGIVHEEDDPVGFDIRQAGGEVSWTHNLSGLPEKITIESVVLKIAVVGLLSSKNNKLFVDGIEIPDSFKGPNDGWNLYSFNIRSDLLSDKKLNITLDADEAEGWGGPDYSELFVYYSDSTLTNKISGTVKISIAGHTNLSVINGIVSLQGTSYSTTTDADGNFTLSDIPTGNYVLHVSSPGLIPLTENISVTAGQDLSVGTKEMKVWIDGSIGLDEVIYALQVVAGLRQ